jgi:nicotinate phosphoribosyltransferase
VRERIAIEDIRNYCAREIDLLWDSLKRFENPQTYYVDLSQKLWDTKDALLHANKQLI